MIIFAFLLSFISVQRPRIIYIDTPNRALDKVPLTNFQVDVEVSGTAAQANYTLKYQNTNNDTLVEAKLKFPFDTDVTVSDVSLQYKNKTIVGQIMKNSEAKIVYDNEKQDKNVAMLVQRIGDYISIDLAGIEPNETFIAKISTYSVLDLKFEHKKEIFFTRYIFPTSMVPRYSPPVQESKKSDNSYKNPYLLADVNYTFDFTLKTTNGQISPESILNIKENTNGKIEYTDTTFSYTGELPNDVNIDIITKSPNSTIKMTIESFENSTVTEISIPASILLEHRKSSSYKNLKSDKKESYVFLIDRSGSMYGETIKKAGSALELFLHSIPSNSVFEIVGFGSSYKPLFNKLVDYNDETLKTAVNYAKKVDSDMGGTEMIEPLNYILEKRPDHLIFLTDGAVSNVEEVKSLCSRYSTQISTISIGDYAAKDLLKTISMQSHGTYEYVDANGQIEGAVIRSLSAIKNGFSIISIKSNCGLLYQSFPILLLPDTSVPFRFFKQNGFSNEKVVVELTVFDFLTKENFSLTIKQDDQFVEMNKVEGKKLHCVALLTAINENVIDDNESFKQSMRLGLMTKQTSFILVDKRSPSEKEKYRSESIEIPVKAYSNNLYGSTYASAMGSSKYVLHATYPPPPRMMSTPKAERMQSTKHRMHGDSSSKIFMSLDKSNFDSFVNGKEGYSTATAADSSSSSDDDGNDHGNKETKGGGICMEISSLQMASGMWDLIKVLVALNVNLSDDDKREWLNKGDGRDELLAALFAIGYLKSECGELHKLVYEKGNKYIEEKFSKQMIQSALKVVEKYHKN